LLAGIIDALPLFAGAAYIAWQNRQAGLLDIESYSKVPISSYIALGFYLLHTLGSELAWGRTLGKKICGLRVAMIDGTPPNARAIITRNLFRAVDLSMFCLPLMLIPATQLRQRIGDIAAETIVVEDNSADKPEDQ
jgi:uncharacterized RDD family membrane protein YckC